MAAPKRDDSAGAYSSRAFFVPVLWIVALLCAYCVLADWQAVPALIAATMAAFQ